MELPKVTLVAIVFGVMLAGVFPSSSQVASNEDSNEFKNNIRQSLRALKQHHEQERIQLMAVLDEHQRRQQLQLDQMFNAINITSVQLMKSEERASQQQLQLERMADLLNTTSRQLTNNHANQQQLQDHIATLLSSKFNVVGQQLSRVSDSVNRRLDQQQQHLTEKLSQMLSNATSNDQVRAVVFQLVGGQLQRQEEQLQQLTSLVHGLSAQLRNLSTERLETRPTNCQNASVTDGIDAFRWFSSAKRFYRFVMEQADWATAADQCKTFHVDAHLAFVKNSAEKEAVKALINDIKTSRGSSAVRSACMQRLIRTDIFWIGGQRVGSSARFGWKTDRHSSPQPMTYTNWSPDGEPNNRGGNENCISIYGDLNWNDFPCNEPACFICQI